MLAPRLGHWVSRLAAALLVAAMVACSSDSQQAEEIVETQQEDSASPATLGGDENSAEVNVVTNIETIENSESTPEVATEINADASGFAPNSTENTAKVDSDGFVVEGVGSKESTPVADQGIDAEDTAEAKSPMLAGSAENEKSTKSAEETSSTAQSAINVYTDSEGKNPGKTLNEGQSSLDDKSVNQNGMDSKITKSGEHNHKHLQIGHEFVYNVKKGDTLSHISLEVYGRVGRWREIAEHNNLSNAELIFPGQKLKIPKMPDQPLRTAAKSPAKNGPTSGRKPESPKSGGFGSGAVKKVEKTGNKKEDPARSEKSAEKNDEASGPAKLNVAGVVWEKKGDYSRVSPDGFATITVKPGFSITKIAEIMFGDGEQWKKVLEFNNLDTMEPNRLFVGQRINFKVPVNPSQTSVAH